MTMPLYVPRARHQGDGPEVGELGRFEAVVLDADRRGSSTLLRLAVAGVELSARVHWLDAMLMPLEAGAALTLAVTAEGLVFLGVRAGR